jgi:hypothetical protein
MKKIELSIIKKAVEEIKEAIDETYNDKQDRPQNQVHKIYDPVIIVSGELVVVEVMFTAHLNITDASPDDTTYDVFKSSLSKVIT